MELLHERCAGLDIGKKDLKACVRTPGTKGKRARWQEIRTFATTTNALLELRGSDSIRAEVSMPRSPTKATRSS